MADKNFRNIFDDLGIGDLPAEKQQGIFNQMNEVVEAAVVARISRMLTDEEAAEFEKLKTDDDKSKFLDEKGIDLQAISLEEAMRLREKLIADVNYAAGRIEEKKAEENSGE